MPSPSWKTSALTIRDPLHDDEERWITIGRDDFDRVLVVIYI
jgi:uncharacterized DUF497 family protein